MTNLSTANFTTNLAAMENVGFENYRILSNDQFASKIFYNTIFYVLVTLGLFNVSMALVVSLLTTHINRRVGFVFRALWILPRITASTVYIMLWRRLVVEAPFGIINQFNTLLGQQTYNYLAERPWEVVILVNGFIGVSFGMIIFTSAIESIPKDLMNASLVDGSTIMQRIRYVILLLRWRSICRDVSSALIAASFEQILLTNGGPVLCSQCVTDCLSSRLIELFCNTQWGMGRHCRAGYLRGCDGVNPCAFSLGELVLNPKSRCCNGYASGTLALKHKIQPVTPTGVFGKILRNGLIVVIVLALVAAILVRLFKPLLASVQVEETVTTTLYQLLVLVLPYLAYITSGSTVREYAKTNVVQAIGLALVERSSCTALSQRQYFCMVPLHKHRRCK
jgi:inositol-phosphate transport system permease protein